MKKFINLITIVLVLGSTFAEAKTQREREREAHVGELGSDKYPFEPVKKNVPPLVREQRFKMSLNQDEHSVVQEKLIRFKMIMESTLGMEILQKPIKKPIKTIDTLHLHPVYWTTILLPEGSVITYADPSFETAEKVKYSENMLNIRPNKGFTNGNIIINYTKDRKNYLLNIIAKNYKTADCKVDEINKSFMCADNNFGIVYEYYDELFSDDSEVLFAYVDLMGEDMQIIKKKGFDSVNYRGTTYYIIKDDKFGDLFFGGSRYRITTQM